MWTYRLKKCIPHRPQISQLYLPSSDGDTKIEDRRWSTSSRKDKHQLKSSRIKQDHHRNQDPLCMMESFLTLLCPTQAYPCFKNIFFLTHLVAIHIYPCLPNHLLICIKKPSWFWHQLETKSYIRTNISISLFLQISRTRLFLRGIGFVKPKICIRKKIIK
jgi:hypothetical protein